MKHAFCILTFALLALRTNAMLGTHFGDEKDYWNYHAALLARLTAVTNDHSASTTITLEPLENLQTHFPTLGNPHHGGCCLNIHDQAFSDGASAL